MADTVLQTVPLGFQWPTIDPFLFCVHHDDAYPAGNEVAGPAASLDGRDLGQDFEGIDGWRMYHGRDVPGFPSHPHRGFETVTYVRRASSTTPTRSGRPPASAGRRPVAHRRGGHRPLRDVPAARRSSSPNPLELFQIWVNLPAEDKLVDPHFAMLWDGDIPRVRHTDADGHRTEVTVIAGALDGLAPAAPPPHSWASRPDADVAIWHLRIEPGARWTLPAAPGPDTVRTLYVFEGDELAIDGTEVGRQHRRGGPLRPSTSSSRAPVASEVLVLQGRPIGEPVARYGPFVMNDGGGDRAGLRRLPGDAVRRLAVAVRRAGAPRAARSASPADPTASREEPVPAEFTGSSGSLTPSVQVCARTPDGNTARPRPVTEGDTWPSSIERCGPHRSATSSGSRPASGTDRPVADARRPLSPARRRRAPAEPRLRPLGRARPGGDRAGVAHLPPGRPRPPPPPRRGARRRHRRRTAPVRAAPSRSSPGDRWSWPRRPTDPWWAALDALRIDGAALRRRLAVAGIGGARRRHRPVPGARPHAHQAALRRHGGLLRRVGPGGPAA